MRALVFDKTLSFQPRHPEPPATAGDTLLHCDLRADNLLLTDDRVWVVDWPWGCTGQPWVDVANLAPSVGMQGGPSPAELFASSPFVELPEMLSRVRSIVALLAPARRRLIGRYDRRAVIAILVMIVPILLVGASQSQPVERLLGTLPGNSASSSESNVRVRP